MTGQEGIVRLGQKKRFKLGTRRDFLRAGVCLKTSVSSLVMGRKSGLSSKPQDVSSEEPMTWGQEWLEPSVKRNLAFLLHI